MHHLNLVQDSDGGMLKTQRSQKLEHGHSFSHAPSRINNDAKRTKWIHKVVSVRALLLFCFAVPVLGLATTSYATTTVSIKQTTSSLSARILTNIVERVAEHTSLAFSETWNMSSALSREIPANRAVEFMRYENIVPILWKVWQNSDEQVVTVWVTDMNGTNTAYYRNTASSPYLKLIHANQTTGYAFIGQVDMNTGQPNFSDPSIYLGANNLDLTKSPWWPEATTYKTQFWTSTYYDETLNTGVIWNTAIFPVLDPVTNATLAFLGIDQTSTNLRDYLSEVYISENAQVWLMKPHSGLLIASSDKDERTYVNPDLGLTYAQDSNLALVRETSLLILNSSDSRTSYELSYHLGGSKIRAQVVSVGFHNLELVLVTAYPESDFLGDVVKVQKQIFIIGSVAFSVSIAFGIFVLVMILVPLTKLGNRMNQISDGLFEIVPNLNTKLFEIRSLEYDFLRMVNALRSFGRFVPTDVVRYLLRNNTEATVGVSQRELTVMFSDIVGFTNKAEVMSPAQLSMLLSDYLSAMCAVIGDNQGTVDKFIGDAIMALWNVPSPVKDHSVQACETALQSIRTLEQLNMKWRLSGLPEVHCRIGLHTGKALVGNLGSKERLSFTAIGDNINLGSRLESLNKKYGTSILISGEVYDAVKTHFLCRYLDVVIVSGRTTPTRLYELVARQSDATPSQKQICKAQAEAVNFYLDKDFESALGGLYQLQKSLPDDMSIKFLIERAAHAHANFDKLPATWTGHLVLDEK